MRTLSSAAKAATRRPLATALSKRAGRSSFSSAAVTGLPMPPPDAVTQCSGSLPSAASTPGMTAPRVVSRPAKSAVKHR